MNQAHFFIEFHDAKLLMFFLYKIRDKDSEKFLAILYEEIKI